MQNCHDNMWNGFLHRTNMDRMMRLFSGGSSSGNSNQISNNGSAGSGSTVSQNTSAPQLTPEQLMSLYGSVLPQIGNTTNTVANTLPGATASNAAVNGAAQAVNAINLNGLSPGEGNAIERSNNQTLSATGNLGLNNSTNTLANAMNFGGAFNSKIGLMNNATNAASTAAGAANNTTGTAASLFNPIANNANAQTSQGTSNAIFSNQSYGKGAGLSSNSSGSFGCFLTTACCQYKGLPDNCEELNVLRQFRDSFVPKHLVERYYRIAPNICVHIQGDEKALEYVYRVVKNCVNDIKEGRKEMALSRYTSMVNKLEQEVL